MNHSIRPLHFSLRYQALRFTMFFIYSYVRLCFASFVASIFLLLFQHMGVYLTRSISIIRMHFYYFEPGEPHTFSHNIIYLDFASFTCSLTSDIDIAIK